MLPIIRAAAVLLAVSLAAACDKEAPPAQRPAPQVTVIAVKPQSIPYIASFVAQTESSQQVDIVARISGYLDKIAYNEGELVKVTNVTLVNSDFVFDPQSTETLQSDGAQVDLRIDGDTDIPGLEKPDGSFEVTAVVGRFRGKR